jgi:hypothetical protein
MPLPHVSREDVEFEAHDEWRRGLVQATMWRHPEEPMRFPGGVCVAYLDWLERERRRIASVPGRTARIYREGKCYALFVNDPEVKYRGDKRVSLGDRIRTARMLERLDHPVTKKALEQKNGTT